MKYIYVVMAFLLGLCGMYGAEREHKLALSIVGGYTSHLVGYGFDMGDKWQAVVFPLQVWSGAIQTEYAFDEVWSAMARIGGWVFERDFLVSEEIMFRWYGNGSDLEGISVGGGLLAMQSSRLFMIYPQLGAAYKWVWRGFFVEPELSVYTGYYMGYLGLNIRLGIGYIF
ncbi:MAG: hypothetical protein HPY78_10190 [Brevinematales bacterium]|nr:hypothetical protein [Brevinematales bacterium]